MQSWIFQHADLLLINIIIIICIFFLLTIVLKQFTFIWNI